MVAEIGQLGSRVAHNSQEHADDIEECEIIEPRFANLVDESESFIHEEEEFADKDAFSDDCLFSQINEIINENFRESQEKILRQRLRLRRAKEREASWAKEIDIKLQQGPN